MRFKILGVLALLVGAYFAVEGVLLSQKAASDTLRAQVYPLVAIFLALVVRVLQAEKHHRDGLKQSAPDAAEKQAAEERAMQAAI
ncbi:MAG TPA: hypothetical protein VM009_03630 [Terriglobales bacterium]|nr:hypothetical protein [Terriglobales bacterium]